MFGTVLRTGLPGYGIAGRVFHAPLITATPGLDLTAIVTGDPSRRDRAHAEHLTSSLVNSVKELFELDLGLLVAATPNRTHVPSALTAIEAGIPVVADKPIAGTSADARRVVKAARYRGVPLTVFRNRRRDGDFLTVKSHLDDGSPGEVTGFESVPGVPGAHSVFYRLLVEALTAGGPVPVDPESAVRAPEVIEAAFTSARTGQVVAV
ncbi:putative dehydrogenase [Saccharothrix tamanrassetensis]|uniref:Putative dehydrogenase n=1 Tax=Saccharothrix tamanrassetensis TaxID=1051531 RepID=A0A841CSS5_9PSEU|nr:Gfo/Idh/MocA family oxidoreductase [Saccharothrix tamanrassetensis]MBB5960320.1 putative dehydrogenase [Saccharothrix tamanrassetensis]